MHHHHIAKTAALMLCALLLLSAPGCTRGERPLRVALIVSSDTGYYWENILDGADAAAKRLGVSLRCYAPDEELGLALEMLPAQALEEGADALVVASSGEEELVEALRQLGDLDFVIGSMHQLPGWDDFAFLDYSKVDAAALFHENLQEIARLARTDTYDVLGHITYALRYMAAAGVQLELAPYREELAEIFRIVIAKDKGIEINTSGLRQAYGDCFPNLECLKLYRELGGKILTIGSDAHTNADLGKGIARGLEIAREAGFTEITYFEKHEPQFIRLADLLD